MRTLKGIFQPLQRIVGFFPVVHSQRVYSLHGIKHLPILYAAAVFRNSTGVFSLVREGNCELVIVCWMTMRAANNKVFVVICA